jgi:hypothetical protein
MASPTYKVAAAFAANDQVAVAGGNFVVETHAGLERIGGNLLIGHFGFDVCLKSGSTVS